MPRQSPSDLPHRAHAPRGARCRRALAAALLVAGCSLAQAQAPTPNGAREVDLTLGGRPTVAELYDPPTASRSAVVLVHGFARTRQTMAGHARELAALGVLAVAPEMPYLVDSRDNARALRDLMAILRKGEHAPPVTRIVLVGFSAGGLAALLAADTPGVVGYLGLDPFDRPNGIGLDAARLLKTPSELLRAPSSACNAFSIAQPWSKALPQLTADRVIPEATHCDFEAPTDWICRAVCGAPDPQRQAIVRETLVNAVRRWLLDATAT